MTQQSVRFETPDAGEETARADLYGLLATLFYAPPSQALLDTIASARAEGDGVLERAWADLVSHSRGMTADRVRDEYEALFIGVGKPDILLYGSYYLSGFLMEKPLAELRDALAEMGLERADHINETEDHIASLCEVMRYLIASDDVLQGSIVSQRRFFGTHMQPWVTDLCAAIDAHRLASYYRYVAKLAQAFFEVEAQAFDMAAS